jgi:hypothetical protein
MTNHDCAEMLSLLSQFRRMAQEDINEPVFDEKARRRIGEMIGQAVRRNGSDYAALR